MPTLRNVSAIALAVVFACGGTASTSYADSVCGEIIKSGVASGKTEDEAKSAAMTWWSSRAGALGEGYQEWKNAKNKSLACHAGPFNTFKCRASAEPCRTDDGKPTGSQSGKQL